MSDGSDVVVVGHFQSRREPNGLETSPGPLDGWGYCLEDLYEIGTETMGFPNRVAVAAFAGDRAYLTRCGAKDPTSIAKTLRLSRWKL